MKFANIINPKPTSLYQRVSYGGARDVSIEKHQQVHVRDSIHFLVKLVTFLFFAVMVKLIDIGVCLAVVTHRYRENSCAAHGPSVFIRSALTSGGLSIQRNAEASRSSRAGHENPCKNHHILNCLHQIIEYFQNCQEQGQDTVQQQYTRRARSYGLHYIVPVFHIMYVN